MRHKLSTAYTAFRTYVDDVVSQFYDVEIMLDDYHRIATVDEFLHHVHENADVLKVQTGGRLVQDEERLARVALAQFGGKLYALALAAGQRCGRLSELDVSQSHVLNGLYLL